jgi:hypothetical protein
MYHKDMEEPIHKPPPSERVNIQPKVKRPTYIKVHRKYLDPETLDEYGLPWMWDPNDWHYLLIKRWISEDLQDALFEHTQKRKKGSMGEHSAGRKDRGKQRTVSDSNGEVILTVDLSEREDRNAPLFGQKVSRKPTADRLEERYGFEAINRISVSSACRFRDPSGKENSVLKYHQTVVEPPTQISFRWTSVSHVKARISFPNAL